MAKSDDSKIRTVFLQSCDVDENNVDIKPLFVYLNFVINYSGYVNKAITLIIITINML